MVKCEVIVAWTRVTAAETPGRLGQESLLKDAVCLRGRCIEF
jgi:hypothetical protein